MKKVKVGILGFGNMGQLHLKNCLLMKDVELAVAEASKLSLRKAEKMGIKELYRDYKELLQKANVDAVVITLPNFLHEESASLAAEKGVDIFVEKPLGRTAEECQSIVESAKKKNVRLMVGLYQRFLDRNRNLKSKIEAGAIGDIELIACEWMDSGPFSHRIPPSPVPEWWFDSKMVGGGVLLDKGAHTIDLIRWLLGDEASVQYVFLAYKFGLQMEDTAILSLQFKTKRTIALFMMGWFAMTSAPTQRLNLYGTAGSTSLSLGRDSTVSTKHTILEMSRNVVRRLLGKEIRPYSLSEVSRAYYEELEHFINCIRENKEPSVTGEDALECAKLIDEAYNLWHSTNSRGYTQYRSSGGYTR